METKNSNNLPSLENDVLDLKLFNLKKSSLNLIKYINKHKKIVFQHEDKIDLLAKSVIVLHEYMNTIKINIFDTISGKF